MNSKQARLFLVPALAMFLLAGCGEASQPSTEAPTGKTTTAAVPTGTPEPRPTATATPLAISPPRRQIIEVAHTTETIYYPVNGVTTEEIFASLEANGPDIGDKGVDMFTLGLAVFEPLFSYTLKDNSICLLDSATLDIKSTVTLPRHANIAALSGRQLDRWRQLEADTALHEQTHVGISLATMKEFTEAALTRALDCRLLESELDTAFDRFIEIETVRQDEFHAEELAKSRAARTLLELLLASAEAELARLDERMDALSSEIATLDVQITRIESRNDGSGIPAAIYDAYKRIIDQHNALVRESKGLVVSYNAGVEKQNGMVEELAWAP